MSTVYCGERDDAQYRQTVAIKVLHLATLHPRLRSRAQQVSAFLVDVFSQADPFNA